MAARAVRRPGLVAVAAGVAALTLGGCDVSGRIDVEPAGARVDLTISGETLGWCTDQALGEPELFAELSPDLTSCHLTGLVPATQGTLNRTYGWLSVADDLAVLAAPTRRGPAVSELEEVTSLDVAVHFPGTVVAAGPDIIARGRSARITDVAVVRDQGAVVVGRMTPPDPAPWLWGIGGLLLGLSLAWGVLPLLRSRV